MNTRLKELFLLHFVNDGVRTILIVLLPFIASEFSLSLTQTGFLGSIHPLIAALLALPTGYIIGKFGGIQVIFTLIIIYSLSIVGIAFSFDIFLLFLFYFLGALGFGMFHTVGFVLTAKNSTPENVGRNMGNFTAIGEIGRVSLPPLALLATSLIGWRMTIGITGTIGIFIFLVAQFFTPPKNTHVLAEENKSSQNHKEFITDIALVFRNKHAAGITLTAIIDTFASSPLNVYLPFLLLAKGMTPAQMGLAMAVFFIGSLLGKWLLGLSVDRLGNRKVFIISEFCMALALLFISQSTEHMLLFLFALILGIFAKGTSPVVQTLFSTLTEKDHYHKVFAFSELVIQLSAAFTITLFGAIADKTGIAIVFYISALLAIIATIPIFSVSKIKNNAVPNVF